MENIKTATSSGLLPHTGLKMCLRKHVQSKKDRGNTTAFNSAALTARVITKSGSEMFYLRVLAVLEIMHSHIAERLYET